MKKCTWCGTEHADEASVCAIDGHPLEAVRPSAPPIQGEVAAIQQGSPVVRAAIVSGLILLLGVFRIVAFAQGRKSPVIFMMLASVLLACGVAVGVVAFWSRRTRTPWSWLRVIAVTFFSYVGFGVFCLALGTALAFISKGFHR